MNEELCELLGALRENTIRDDQRARLSKLLSENPEHRQYYVRYMLLTATLSKHDIAAMAPRKKTSTLRRWFASAAAVAAILALCILTQSQTPPPEKSTPPRIASLTAGTDLIWETSGASYMLGDSLPAGRCRLRSGIAQITFQSGATAILRAPAEIDLVAADRAFLYSGQVVVRVPHSAKGFHLETHTARLLDLGTEFGVNVDSNGGSLLQVYEGEVLANLKAKTEKNSEQRVEEGRAVGLEPDFHEVPFWPDRFVRTLPDRDDPNGRGDYPYNTSRFSEIHLVPATHVTIDGDLSDWDLSGRFTAACVPPYGENHYVEAALMYDERFLYIGAHVGDPFPMRSQVSPHVNRELYGMGGGIALRISTDRQAKWPLHALSKFAHAGQPMTSEDLNDKLSFIMLWYYQPEKKACLQLKHGMDLHNPTVNPEGYTGAYREDPDGKGYTAEYAIPWSLLNGRDDPPRGGDTLAAMWLVHWSNAQGRAWKGHLIDVMKPQEPGWNFDRAATWGKAIYHAQGHLESGTVKPTDFPQTK